MGRSIKPNTFVLCLQVMKSNLFCQLHLAAMFNFRVARDVTCALMLISVCTIVYDLWRSALKHCAV